MPWAHHCCLFLEGWNMERNVSMLIFHHRKARPADSLFFMKLLIQQRCNVDNALSPFLWAQSLLWMTLTTHQHSDPTATWMSQHLWGGQLPRCGKVAASQEFGHRHPPHAGSVQFMNKAKALKILITAVRTGACHIISDQTQNEPSRARSYKANWQNSTENRF